MSGLIKKTKQSPYDQFPRRLMAINELLIIKFHKEAQELKAPRSGRRTSGAISRSARYALQQANIVLRLWSFPLYSKLLYCTSIIVMTGHNLPRRAVTKRERRMSKNLLSIIAFYQHMFAWLVQSHRYKSETISILTYQLCSSFATTRCWKNRMFPVLFFACQETLRSTKLPSLWKRRAL